MCPKNSPRSINPSKAPGCPRPLAVTPTSVASVPLWTHCPRHASAHPQSTRSYLFRLARQQVITTLWRMTKTIPKPTTQRVPPSSRTTRPVVAANSKSSMWFNPRGARAIQRVNACPRILMGYPHRRKAKRRHDAPEAASQPINAGATPTLNVLKPGWLTPPCPSDSI